MDALSLLFLPNVCCLLAGLGGRAGGRSNEEEDVPPKPQEETETEKEKEKERQREIKQ